jgi:deoxyribonuclease V
MKVRTPHPWGVTIAEARAIQETLRGRVVTTPSPELPLPPRTVAGIDVSCPGGTGRALAGVVVMSLPGMEVIERRSASLPLTFPYVPGFLSFREGEAVTEALGKVRSPVDVFLFDGQGVCHPRRFGLASHIGVILDRPAVGCAKSLLMGKHREPAAARGSGCRILKGKEVLGCALRTRHSVRPVYVSVGHLVDLPAALKIVLACGRGFRIPEPLREAHRWVTEMGREHRRDGPSAAEARGQSLGDGGGSFREVGTV